MQNNVSHPKSATACTISAFCRGFIFCVAIALTSTGAAKMSSPDEIDALVRQGKYDEARAELEFFPGNREKEKRQWRIDIARAAAKQAAQKKNWKKAQEEFEEALHWDPDNKNILELVKEIQQLREQFALHAERAVETSLSADVRDAWTQKSSAPLPLTSLNAIPMTRKNDFVIHRKLEKIILPEVEFSQAKIEDIAFFLTERSRQYDSQKSGVSFLAQDEAKQQAKPVTLSLRNIPLSETIRYIAELAQVKFRVEEKAVIIEPLVSSQRTLATREFFARRQFLFPDDLTKKKDGKESPKPSKTATAEADLVKLALQKRGVIFQNPPDAIPLPDGSVRAPRADEFPSAVYSSSTGMLTVRNTQDQIDYLEQLILSDMANQGVERLIKVETRILEINQNDLDELGVNWTFNNGKMIEGALPGSRSGSHMKLSAVSAQSNLGGANELARSGIDRFLEPDDVSQNSFAVRGLLDGVTFQAILNALSQKKSANLVSAPTILLNSGSGGATIEVAREFIYPKAWNPPQVKLFRKDRFGGDEDVIDRVIVPSWPTQFEENGRKVGVSIDVVKAQADRDNKKVSLELKPTITDFEGFVNYGSPILAIRNDILVPIFTVRAFDDGFKLDIQDGYTMVVGGLIREEIQSSEDKIPVLGDLPFLGSLFRSKANRSVRKNLLLFVTPRILQPSGQPINP